MLPLRRKVLHFSVEHVYRPLHEKRKTDHVVQKTKKRTRVEANTNRSTRTNKHKSRKKTISAAPALPQLPISNVSFSTGGVAMPFDDVIKDLEAKLKANYEYELCLQKEQNAKLLGEKTSEFSIALEEKRSIELQNMTVLQEKQQLLDEKGLLEDKNRSLLSEKELLQLHNSSLLSEKERLMSENGLILEEKERLDADKERLHKQVRELGQDKIRSVSRSYVKKLEDATKEHMATGVNRKFLAEKLADTVRRNAYGGLCGN